MLFFVCNILKINELHLLCKGGLLRCEGLPFTWRKLTFCAVKAYLLPFVDYTLIF